MYKSPCVLYIRHVRPPLEKVPLGRSPSKTWFETELEDPSSFELEALQSWNAHGWVEDSVRFALCEYFSNRISWEGLQSPLDQSEERSLDFGVRTKKGVSGRLFSEV